MMRRRLLGALGVLAGLGVLAAALVLALNLRGESPLDVATDAEARLLADRGAIERGAYLARAGNCMTCHTARGGAAWAGGRGIETPFGTVFSSNLTPDPDTGLGQWTSAHFWRAMHNGRSRDGRLLYPAFPYTSFTEITREDSDALFAYLRSLEPVRQDRRPHALGFPYSTQAALAVWRALYFAPAPFVPDTTRDATWNRGAYLVRGLGHCAACHSARDSLGGGNPLDLQGGLIPVQNWYAPSLSSAREAGVAQWPREEVIALLRTGTSKLGQVTGPMAEVVQHSTQHLSDADLSAMTAYLQALPQSAGATDAPATPGPVPERVAARGAELYGSRCAGCHGERGEGVTAAYPALAGNRAVTLANPANAIQMVLYGGFGPATPGNPRPFGMPPYVLALSDEDIAAVVTHIRGQWGNQAAAVTTVDIARVRGVGR